MNPTTSNHDLLQVERLNVEATILFCDVRGYTKIAETIPTAPLLQRLGSYFCLVADTVKEHRGTLAKFIGDAALVYWLAEENADHADLACRFAVSLNQKLFAASSDITTTTGIHTGNVALVKIELENYRSLEPLGDVVNAACRFGMLCKEFQVYAVASERVIAQSSKAQLWSQLDTIHIKGKTEPVVLYGLKG